MANLFTTMILGKVAVSLTHLDEAHVALKTSSPVLIIIPVMIMFLGEVILTFYPTCLLLPDNIATGPQYLQYDKIFLSFTFCLLPLTKVFINLQLLIPWVVLCLVQIMTFRSRNVLPRVSGRIIPLLAKYTFVPVEKSFFLILVSRLLKIISVSQAVSKTKE